MFLFYLRSFLIYHMDTPKLGKNVQDYDLTIIWRSGKYMLHTTSSVCLPLITLWYGIMVGLKLPLQLNGNNLPLQWNWEECVRPNNPTQGKVIKPQLVLAHVWLSVASGYLWQICQGDKSTSYLLVAIFQFGQRRWIEKLPECHSLKGHTLVAVKIRQNYMMKSELIMR